MPEISVIVPVYKVEAYLDRCVKSILAQTFTDFELILVDDGSPDRCPEMCDTWEGKDSRIHVIHQKNGGLSAARNAGIDWAFANSDSRWLTFIDSDDWVHPRYLEVLNRGITQTGMQVSICEHKSTSGEIVEVDENRLFVELWKVEDYYIKHNSNSIVSVAKLYNKEGFREIRFPVERIHEDVFTTHRVLFQNQQVAVIQQPLYYYFQNLNSITHKRWSIHRLDWLVGLDEQIAFFKRTGKIAIVMHMEKIRMSVWAMNVIAAKANGYYYKFPKKYHMGFWKAIRTLQKELGIDRYEGFVVNYYPTLVRLQAYGRKIKKVIFLWIGGKK